MFLNNNKNPKLKAIIKQALSDYKKDCDSLIDELKQINLELKKRKNLKNK